MLRCAMRLAKLQGPIRHNKPTEPEIVFHHPSVFWSCWQLLQPVAEQDCSSWRGGDVEWILWDLRPFAFALLFTRILWKELGIA